MIEIRRLKQLPPLLGYVHAADKTLRLSTGDVYGNRLRRQRLGQIRPDSWGWRLAEIRPKRASAQQIDQYHEKQRSHVAGSADASSSDPGIRRDSMRMSTGST